MKLSIKKSALLAALCSTLCIQNYAFAHADMAITARVMPKTEYTKKFYPLPGVKAGYEDTDLNYEHIYPIAFSLENKGNKAIEFTIDKLAIKDACILTPKTLASLVSTAKNAATVSLVLLFPLFPISLIMFNQGIKLEQFMPLVAQFGPGNETVVIKPQEKFETVLFIHHIPVRTIEKTASTPVAVSANAVPVDAVPVNFKLTVELQGIPAFSICVPSTAS